MLQAVIKAVWLKTLQVMGFVPWFRSDFNETHILPIGPTKVLSTAENLVLVIAHVLLWQIDVKSSDPAVSDRYLSL